MNSDQPVDPMEDEERELTQLNNSKKINRINAEFGNTGISTMKNSLGAVSYQHNKIINHKRGSQANTEKEYDCLINNIRKQVHDKEEFLKSDKYLDPQNSFSFDNNEILNKTVQDKNISLNKSNFLTYDKKVKAFKKLNETANGGYLENTKLVA